MLVLCFSIGLALTLVTVGAAAAIGAKQASNRWPWMGTVARRALYLSSALIIGIDLYVGLFLVALGAAALLPMQSESVLDGMLVQANTLPRRYWWPRSSMHRC